MDTQTVAQVAARIEALLPRARRPVIATDADGTLWTGDVGEDAFDALVARRAIREQARPRLAEEATAAGLDGSGDANDIAARIRDAYLAGAFAEVQCYELMSWAFAGFRVEEAHAFIDDVQQETRLDARLHGEMASLVAWATGRGLEVWIVSASPSIVVERGARRFGIPSDRIVGAFAGIIEGFVVPKLSYPVPYGAGKVTAMARAIGEAEIVAAFGDNAFDLEMLARAAIPVAVRPKPRLRSRELELPGMIELSPR